jgi:hypothetical protein
MYASEISDNNDFQGGRAAINVPYTGRADDAERSRSYNRLAKLPVGPKTRSWIGVSRSVCVSRLGTDNSARDVSLAYLIQYSLVSRFKTNVQAFRDGVEMQCIIQP